MTLSKYIRSFRILGKIYFSNANKRNLSDPNWNLPPGKNYYGNKTIL